MDYRDKGKVRFCEKIPFWFSNTASKIRFCIICWQTTAGGFIPSGVESRKIKKLCTIAEELIKPNVLEMTTTILGNEARKKRELVPLSKNVFRAKLLI